MRSRTRVAVVGAGPIGLELAVELRRSGIDFEILDAGSIGHTMTWWAPQTRWFSSNERIAIAGVPLETVDQTKATREQYLTYLRAVARQFEIRVRSFERAVAIDRERDGFLLRTESASGSGVIHADRVVLAVGGTDRPRRLGVPGEDLPHVDGYLREPHLYFGQRVLIIGGRNSAIEAALRLHHVGANVAISYRRPTLPSESIKYWLRPEIEGLIRSGRIQSHFSTMPIQITPQHVVLAPIEPISDDCGEESFAAPSAGEVDPQTCLQVPADAVLSLIGYVQDKQLLRSAGVELVGPNERPSFDEETMETNVPGLYLAGTAVAGTQSSHYKIFLENCHSHIAKIVGHLQDQSSSPRQRVVAGADRSLAREIEAMPES